MSVYQTMQAINSLTLNRKGAVAFSTTGDERLDLFTLCSKDPYMTKGKFVELYELMTVVCKKSPEALLQLLAFQRSIAKGNGIKHYYYMGAGILEKCCLDKELYKEMIRFSYQYTKDLYRVGNSGLELFAEKILEQLFILLSPIDPEQKTRFDPMLFKYLGYEDSHWRIEKKRIQVHLNSLVDEKITEFIQLVNSTEDLEKDQLQTRLLEAVRQLFRGSNSTSQIFTNRRMRILKTIFNKENHLPEYLYAGKHYDGTLLDETVDSSGKFLQESIDKIAKDMSQTSGLATTIMCKSFKKMQKIHRKPEKKRRSINEFREESDEDEDEFQENKDDINNLIPLTVRQNLLLDGYIQYKENIAKKLVKVKEIGVDLAAIAYTYFITGEDPTGLEQQLISRIERLKSEWLPLFDSNFTIDKFRDSFRVIMDRSGSMNGIPLQTGLLYLLILSVIFRVKEIIYFDDNVEIRKLTDADLDGPILDLLKKIYTSVQGSTQLKKALQYLEQNRIGNVITVIISDSDCDPSDRNVNAYHNAFSRKNKYLPTNQYVIMNVNEEKMRFPYMDFHEKTCFITGTSTVAFLIEALIKCSKERILLTPGLVLQQCLNSTNFKLPESILSGLRDCDRFDSSQLITDEYELSTLYERWIDDLPKKEVSTLLNLELEDFDMDE
jgi:hypothetical protein